MGHRGGVVALVLSTAVTVVALIATLGLQVARRGR